MKRLSLLIIAAIVLPSLKIEDKEDEKTGSLEGTVIFESPELSKTKPISNKDKDTTTCGHEVIQETLLFKELKNDKSDGPKKKYLIQNVIADLKIGTKGKKGKDETYVLDQLKCVFTPHVLVIKRNGKVEFKNSDEVTHNVHLVAKKNPSPNIITQPKGSTSYSPRFEEIIKVTCDIHPWMSAYLVVSNNPLYTKLTNEDGKFEIKDIPEGKYKISFWHEQLGEITKDVEIKAGETSKMEIVYKTEK